MTAHLLKRSVCSDDWHFGSKRVVKAGYDVEGEDKPRGERAAVVEDAA